MVHVFCDRKGTGKTKALINMANEKVLEAKGNIVYIDDDSRPMLELDNRIRFVNTNDFSFNDYNSFYSFLCGVISEDYDIDNVFVDGLSNIVFGDINDAVNLFSALEKLAFSREIEFFINLNNEKNTVPDFIKKYVA